MRRLSLILVILGIFVLLFFFFSSPKEVGEIDDLELNTKVSISGEVVGERTFGSFRIFEIGGMTITCDCDKSYLGEIVEVLGVIEEYNGEKQIAVLKISISG